MTTIAATKFQIAGDRQANHNGGLKFKIPNKLASFYSPILYKVPFHVGLCGNIKDFPEVWDFFRDPTTHKKSPSLRKGEGLVLSEDGKLWTFSNASNWFRIDQDYYAIGSGMNFAMGAMADGASAYDAVKIAAKLDPSTGMGITKINLGKGKGP